MNLERWEEFIKENQVRTIRVPANCKKVENDVDRKIRTTKDGPRISIVHTQGYDCDAVRAQRKIKEEDTTTPSKKIIIRIGPPEEVEEEISLQTGMPIKSKWSQRWASSKKKKREDDMGKPRGGSWLPGKKELDDLGQMKGLLEENVVAGVDKAEGTKLRPSA